MDLGGSHKKVGRTRAERKDGGSGLKQLSAVKVRLGLGSDEQRSHGWEGGHASQNQRREAANSRREDAQRQSENSSLLI